MKDFNFQEEGFTCVKSSENFTHWRKENIDVHYVDIHSASHYRVINNDNREWTIIQLGRWEKLTPSIFKKALSHIQ
jgi:hypothetical protein